MPEKKRIMANACYDHIGSHLGAVIMERVLELGWIEPTGNGRFRITVSGREGFGGWGIDVSPLLNDRT